MPDISDLIYTHEKTGNHYRVLHIGIEEGSMTPVVIYTSIFGGTVWTRPVAEFFDGRFVTGGSGPMAEDTELSMENGDRESAAPQFTATDLGKLPKKTASPLSRATSGQEPVRHGSPEQRAKIRESRTFPRWMDEPQIEDAIDKIILSEDDGL